MEYIVKYDVNRKMYSKTLKKYVNLDYLIDLVKTGQENKFMVVRHEKGVQVDDMKDITSEVMAEAIKKLEPSKAVLFNLIKVL